MASNDGREGKEAAMAALSVVLHAETTTRVEVHKLSDHSVSVVIGDDRAGLRLIGDTDEVAHLIDRAHGLLEVAQG
jgi:hypothetical protein